MIHRPPPRTFRLTEGIEIGASVPQITRCAYCGDSGWTKRPVAVNHPDFGRLFACDCKLQTYQRRQRAKLLAASQLSSLADQTFAQFDADISGVRSALLTALQYAEQPSGSLILLGSTGCGKTHLAAAIALHTVDARPKWTVLFQIVPDLLDYLRAGFDQPESDSFQRRLELICTADLLVLDDLGTEHTTPWASEQLFRIIDKRTIARRPTVVTSNKPEGQISPLIRSRLSQYAFQNGIVVMRGADYRLRHLTQRWPAALGEER